MSSPGWDLQQAVYAALAASETLNLLLGGERIYDATPQAAAFPFLVIDQTQIRDWSTGTEQGAEHVLLLHIWSRNESKQEAYEIADTVRDALDGAALSPDQHHLVNLTHQYSDLKRDEDGKTYHGVIRFRAVTEPLALV
jgi:hypothetical protein